MVIPFLTFLLSLISPSIEDCSPRTLGDNEYRAYSVIIEHAWRKYSGDLLVIQSETDTTVEAYRYPNPKIARTRWQLFASAFDDYERQNCQAMPISEFPSDRALVFLERNEMPPAVTLSKFQELYHGAEGFVQLSHLGRDDSDSHALVYAAYHQFDQKKREANYYFLEKIKGTWTLNGVPVGAWSNSPLPPTRATQAGVRGQ
jgi:hypothetical protein